jgi:decaprenylphospho-beta-D-erythro-pentofuranosid-2-ulose 2-reductase
LSRDAGRRPVLILGARSDIAQALARVFAERGHPLQLAAREPDTLERDRKDLAVSHGVDVSLHRYDATDLDALDAFFDGLPKLPRIVISAVGLLGDQDADAGDPHRAERVIAANFTGPALSLEIAALRLARLDEPAALIGIGSVAGDRGRARNYVYGSAKAGFAQYLSGLRQKHARSRLHVMTVKPGFVATSMTEGMELPAILTTTPEGLARRIVRSLDRGRMVHYDFRWWLLMTVIRLIPERLFSRLRF